MNKATENKTMEQWLSWLKWFKNHRYSLSIDENLALRDAIIMYYCVAVEFFYKTMEPMNKGIANNVFESYGVSISLNDIATWVYTAVYNEGKWSRLNCFSGNCSIFSWISVVASQTVFKELREMHLIPGSSELSSNNTSLTLLSMKHVDEVKCIIDYVHQPLMNEVLNCLYVKRMPLQAILKNLNISEELFSETRKIAETMLKESLIREEVIFWEREDGTEVNLVSLAISDVSNTLHTSTSTEAFILAENTYCNEDDYEELNEVLEEYYPRLPWKEQWRNFIVDKAMEMGWSQEDQIVFVERFCNNTSPVVLAQRLGRARTWVDNKFSRELKALTIVIKKWWNEASGSSICKI